jgi:hypothetical protein
MVPMRTSIFSNTSMLIKGLMGAGVMSRLSQKSEGTYRGFALMNADRGEQKKEPNHEGNEGALGC